VLTKKSGSIVLQFIHFILQVDRVGIFVLVCVGVWWLARGKLQLNLASFFLLLLLYEAYLLVHSLADLTYLSRSVLYILAISGTSGSSGLGSVSSEQIESKTFAMVSAGDHCDRRISRQIEPLELMLGW
jgi:small-conductance mechanosensitive channel